MPVVEAEGSMRTSMEILGRSHGHLAEWLQPIKIAVKASPRTSRTSWPAPRRS